MTPAANYRSTLGGACSATGTFLMGFGVTSQFAGTDSTLVHRITFAGFVLMGLGTFFGHLFAADAKDVANLTRDVKDIQSQVSTNTFTK